MLSQETAQRFEQWKLTLLSRYPKNPRRHSDAQIAQNIRFQLANPESTPKAASFAGRGRYLAALTLGLEEAPVIRLDHLSEIEKRAYILADNKLAELSDWDNDSLASELADFGHKFRPKTS